MNQVKVIHQVAEIIRLMGWKETIKVRVIAERTVIMDWIMRIIIDCRLIINRLWRMIIIIIML